MDSNHLLVPINVQALVINDAVEDRRGVIEIRGKYAANDFRWSPLTYDYQQVPRTLTPPGPMPFYGAEHQYAGATAEQLVLPKDSPALPTNQDRGVYLHWILPAGLRHAYTPGLFDFPALPDHWLIVRFSHQNAAVKTRAWFVDGGAIATEEKGNLLFVEDNKYIAKGLGKVTPLEEFGTANFSDKRTDKPITALGNATTGSPTFTAFIAENRNIFSWHDKLEDLRQPNATGKVPEETTLTYLVLGWYRTPTQEPLAASEVTVTPQHEKDVLRGWLIDPPGWFVDASSGGVELRNRRSVFHGMVAHINYWSANTYKGQMLGYPGSPPVEGVLRDTPPSFTIGVGNNAEDALVSLVSSSYSALAEDSILAEKQPNLWNALEAVIYRQTESLVKSWNIASRDITVHENWFVTRDAGKIWYLRPKSKNKAEYSQNADETVRETKAQPTADQLTRLNELNRVQAEADAISRELSALQADLYARWWKMCAKSRNRMSDRLTTADEKECDDVVKQIGTLRGRLAGRINELLTLPAALEKTLGDKLELKSDAAPRFWLPADPVVVVKDCGRPTKHQFPRQHPCRLPDQVITTAEVVVSREDKVKEPKTFNTPAGVADIAAAAKKHLPACPEVLPALLDEGSIVEQAINDLAARTLPAGRLFEDEAKWKRWTQRLDHDLRWDGDPRTFPLDEVKFGKPNALNIPAARLVDLWLEQPWSPLFLDWEITWFPTTLSSTSEHSFGPAWVSGQADFSPLNAASIPQKGFTLRGRSLLSPIDERIFKEPIDMLRELIREDNNSKGDNSFSRADVREVLKRYEIVWDKTLKELSGAGLMGQALTGFHQALLRRDSVRPRMTPDPARPWMVGKAAIEDAVSKALEPPNQPGVASEPFVPPVPTTANKDLFSMIRAGALRINELWLVDDFGQTADLLSGSTIKNTAGGRQVFHPRVRWHNDESVLAMPPRVLQPVRLNFRFTGEDENKKCDPALDPICGWLFFNPLDRALVLCDRCGELMGHLVITKDAKGRRVSWEAGAGGVPIDKITNPSLKKFAESFIQTTSVPEPKLVELLNLIDGSLSRIRPAAARNNTLLVGRPLALVNATIGLELFGKAWTDPYKAVVPGGGTGNEALDALSVRVNLGDLQNVEDGLIGYFKAGAYDRIVVPQLPEKLTASDYIGDPKKYAVQVGFGPPKQITLLMDPWGSVQAACGIVPAKTISLANAVLDETVAQMETSFRVGPVLVQADSIALPTPTGDKGVWNFSSPLTNHAATTVAAFDPKHFSDQPVVATEGRLLLLNEE